MKKIIISGIILLCSLVLGITGLLSYQYFNSKVDKLITHYPVYDEDKNDYILSPVRPEYWLRIDEISYYAKWAIIVSEDWAFYDHRGIDFNQLKKAILESVEEGELTRGASTITQQVVKNALLTNKREISRKIKEIILASIIESKYSKDKILEIYLNLIELGKGIYGIKEASFYYFNKNPRDLNAREGAFLAMLLPSPVKYSTSFYEKELTNFAKEQVDSILIKLRQAKVYTEEERVIESKKRFYWEEEFYKRDDIKSSSEDNEELDGYDQYLQEAL